MTGKLKNGLTDLRGVQVGELLVLNRVRVAEGRRPRWRCKCLACHSRITVSHNRLIDKNNPKTHCGCLRPEGVTTILKKEYHAWWDARERCHNPEHPSYNDYGAKGVTMHPEWRKSFDAFLKHIGPAPKPKPEYSLDRINTFGNYAPGNIRWATASQQARNKRGTKFVKHPITGTPIRAAELADEMNLSYQQLRNRLVNRGEW